MSFAPGTLSIVGRQIRNQERPGPEKGVMPGSSQLLAAWSQIFGLLAFDVIESRFEFLSHTRNWSVSCSAPILCISTSRLLSISTLGVLK